MTQNLSPRQRVLDLITQDFDISRGKPLPLGAIVVRGGINFALFSRNATQVNLVLFDDQADDAVIEFPLDPTINKTGDIWHVFVRGLNPGIQYGYRITRDPNEKPNLHRFDPNAVLLDPYCKAISGRAQWGFSTPAKLSADDYKGVRRSLIVDDEFDWNHDQPLNIHLADSVIYEMHVRGFTQHPSSGVEHPGSFLGLIEKIPYLQSLGVTAVELLPITDFEETDNTRINPNTNEPLFNFWGYHPISFFAPKASYAWHPHRGAQVKEFKEMVKAFHKAGIEVILDMVFNHTGEGDERGTTYSFRGLDNAVYYLLDPQTHAYRNYSGCGNTLNCNHPVVRDMILDALRYWVSEMHVDGFRFDLASILGRGRDGSVLADPPLVERIAADPLLAHTKIIAEAWDAAGLYQVGSFPAWSRWAEWNGKFRDDIRRFVRGDSGMVTELAKRMAGSPDLYQTSAREPHHSINFVTCHDGFTLADLVSYNEKHNEANGEDNRDGCNENFSWNCGVEGSTVDPVVNELRVRQMKNLATLLMLANGVPMLLAGDEVGRSQKGNNNAYCQDNELNWIDWRDTTAHHGLLEFFRRLVRFRRDHALLRQRTFSPGNSHGGSVWHWHGVKPYTPDWSDQSRSLAMQLGNPSEGDPESIYIIANAYWEELTFQLPPTDGRHWHRVADTSLPAPDDFAESGKELPLSEASHYVSQARSVVVLLCR